MGGKAKAVAEAISSLDQSAEACDMDIVSLLRDKAERRRVLPKKTAYWSTRPPRSLPCEAIGVRRLNPHGHRAMLYRRRSGRAFDDGGETESNCLDLIAEAYVLISAHARLRPLILTGAESAAVNRSAKGAGRSPWRFPTRDFDDGSPMAEIIRERLHQPDRPPGANPIGMIQEDGLSVTGLSMTSWRPTRADRRCWELDRPPRPRGACRDH